MLTKVIKKVIGESNWRSARHSLKLLIINSGLFAHVKEADGMKFKVRWYSSDDLIVKEVITNNEYEIDEKARLPEKPIIIDIGAQIGVFSVFLAHTKHARVYSFEPFEKNFKLLQENIKINHLEEQITARNLGISDEKKTSRLYLSSNSGGHSMHMRREGKYIDIACISFADVLEQHHIKKIDLLKLDCEGAEYEILFSIKPEEFEMIDQIVLEYHENENIAHTGKGLAEFLTKMKFKVSIKDHNNGASGMIWAGK